MRPDIRAEFLLRRSHHHELEDGLAGGRPRTAEDVSENSAAQVAVIIPAFNEESTIAHVLRLVDALPCVREIIVVDDCSTDATASVVEACATPRTRLLRLPVNRGKAAAIEAALREVSSPITIIQDADLEYDPKEIPFVIEPIVSGKADVVYGSRFLVRKAARVAYFHHYLANKMLTFCSNMLTNLNMSDIETGYKAFVTPLLTWMPITSRGFGIEVEITAMISKTRARIYEVPISYYGRTYEEGKKIGFRDAVQAFWYIAFYNTIAAVSRRRRAYLTRINDWLIQFRGGGGAVGGAAEHVARISSSARAS
jgi:glycosyltransferase involved in cell wall biosynthesis